MKYYLWFFSFNPLINPLVRTVERQKWQQLSMNASEIIFLYLHQNYCAKKKDLSGAAHEKCSTK